MADRFDQLVAFMLGPCPDENTKPCYPCGAHFAPARRQGRPYCGRCAKDYDAQREEMWREQAGDQSAK